MALMASINTQTGICMKVDDALLRGIEVPCFVSLGTMLKLVVATPDKRKA